MEDISIYDIIRLENLPYRTLKICKQLGINSLSGIISYFQENKTFLKTNVCGKKTNQDLVNVYKKYTSKVPESTIPIPSQSPLFLKDEAVNLATINTKTMTYKISQLNDQQRSIIDNKIEIKTEELSVRGKHAIKNLLQDNFTIENLHNYVFSDKYFNFKNIRNVGKNTIPELNNFIIEIREEIDKLLKFNKSKITGLADSVDSINEKLNNEFALSALQKYFRFKDSDYESINAYYLKTKIFPVFKMLDILIQKEYIFNNTELLVFNHILNFTTFENKPVQDVAVKADLTGERIRQIKFILLNNFESLFSFISIFNKLAKYNKFDPSLPYISVDDDEADKINSKEGVHFSKLFYINIFALLAIDTHRLIGNLSSNSLETKIKKIVNNDYCLIFKHLSEVFDFNAFLKKIFVLTGKRKTKTLSYNLENFIQQFYLSDRNEDHGEIFEVCRRILNDNFNIGTDNQGNINFLRNTKKLTFEYLVDILEENKRPMHFVEMYKECVKRGYPIKSDMGVHSTLINHSDIFGLKGAGTFTLRKFGGYFGTIGNVAERYLLEKAKPVPLAEMEKFINKELIISKYSIRMVLFKYKHEDRFMLDKKNLVSLKEWSLVADEKDK